MSVNGVEETKGFPLTPCGWSACHWLRGGGAAECISAALLNLPLCMQLLNVYLWIILIMGTFLPPAADRWLFQFNQLLTTRMPFLPVCLLTC